MRRLESTEYVGRRNSGSVKHFTQNKLPKLNCLFHNNISPDIMETFNCRFMIIWYKKLHFNLLPFITSMIHAKPLKCLDDDEQKHHHKITSSLDARKESQREGGELPSHVFSHKFTTNVRLNRILILWTAPNVTQRD